MTIRRGKMSHPRYRNRLKRRYQRLRRDKQRRLQMEALESRQLLAVGPQLAGVQPRDGALLSDGDVRNVAPSDLLFHFNAGQAIDPATVGAIRITQSGFDGQFERARAATDFNTNGAAVIDFSAVQPSLSGNGITIDVIKNDLGPGVLPRIRVIGDMIHVELNTNATTPTLAGQLRDTINTDADARRLVSAALRAGSNANANIAAPLINYSPIVLDGANRARATTTFNAGPRLQVTFTAVQQGLPGNGIEIVVTRTDRGGVAPPRITVNQRTITIDLNANLANATTAGELVEAVNTNPAARALVSASLDSGSRTTTIGNRFINFSPLRLLGANDINIVPGFVGLGDTSRQVVFRFKEPLADDLYLVEILGTGPGALRNIDGDAFGDATDDGLVNGRDVTFQFELDLAPQIVSVVPQPVRRQGNTLVQMREEIHIYFNNDDLHNTPVSTQAGQPNPSVVDPAFYQLIFTNGTVQNTDDLVFRPQSISYDPASDRAVLKFASGLDQLGAGPGTFRLRVGTDEAIPLAPLRTNAVADPGSSFDTALGVGVEIRVVAGGAGVVDGQTFSLTDDATPPLTTTFTFDDGSGPAGPTAILFNPGMDAQALAARIAQTINNAGLGFVAAVGGGNRIAITGAVRARLGAGLTALSRDFLNSVIISSQIEAKPFDLPFPGDDEEPGGRDLPDQIEQHLFGAGDSTDGVSTIFYNFRRDIGFDPAGNPVFNVITEQQKQRARESFELYSDQLGVQFVETTNQGLTIATGDMRAIIPNVISGPGGIFSASIFGGPGFGIVIMDAAEDWDDGFGATDDPSQASWFEHATSGIGTLLGVGLSSELPPLTLNTVNTFGETVLLFDNAAEPIYPGDHDIVHGQHLFRPEGQDIDLYRLEIPENGLFTAEVIAERLPNSSLLDGALTLYRQNADGRRELIARNDDYFSNDAYLEIELRPGTYWVGVSSTGNTQYDPVIEDTGFGGTSEGPYDLRLGFRPDADRTLRDATGTDFDGDGDGVPGGVFDFWFKASQNTVFVDKAAVGGGTGSLANPFTRIDTALVEAANRALTDPNVIVRIVGNSGPDGLRETLEDNRAYEIGFNNLGNVLADGHTLNVPRGVTVMIDSGAIIKSRRARIGVGSSSPVVDRSGGALQVLGTPVLLNNAGQVIRDEVGNIIPGSVYLTSIHDTEIGADTNPDSFPPPPASGDWGGISLRNDVDRRDANRVNLEDRGIFLNYINNAQMLYGGGTVVVDGIPRVIAPIEMADARPMATFNTIRHSADAAMSASPDSFEETNFHAPRFQFNPFTSDYQRVGPAIYHNSTTDNSINGLFVRVMTPAGNQLQPLTVPGRWNDRDIPHVLAENLIVQGTPGGPIQEIQGPPVQIVTLRSQDGGELAAGDYNYRITFVDAAGNEGAPSDPTATLSITGAAGDNAIRLDNLPAAGAGFVARRVYRSTDTGFGPFTLVAEINATSTFFVDTGATVGGPLRTALLGLRARTNARLAIDPGVVVKLNGGAIETRFGGQLIAEGVEGREIVFTSTNDDRFGGSGTFDTTDNGNSALPLPGDWGGLLIGHSTSASINQAHVAYGGGEVRIAGTFAGFNAVEVHQAEARITRSLFEHNADGTGGQSTPGRAGRGSNADGLIFIRGAQPIIVDNAMLNNAGPVINVNANALNSDYTVDPGRTTFSRGEERLSPLGRIPGFGDNEGPLVRLNRIDDNGINGMAVRGATLTTQSVWDDTDIVHIVRDEMIYVPDFHTFGGLRLESSPTESLVVKLQGPNSGFTATGRPLDIDDRIGGTLQVIGQASHPVVLTSIEDCTVGAGFTPDGVPQTDTLNRGQCGAVDAIFGPMIDQFTDAAPNIDEWFVIADNSRSIAVEVFENNQGVIAIDGQNPLTLTPNQTATITLNNVVPGSQHVFTHELIGGLSHYRPRFIGAERVFMLEDRTSPNDVFNSSSGGGSFTGSNLELGFDARFDTLPSIFADTTWFYELDVGDTITWRGFFDDFPGGADAVRIDLIDPNGVVVQTAGTQPLLPGAGTTFTATVQNGQAGDWGVKLTAPPVITPFAGHYLMDVEVTDAQGLRDPIKSARHYLLPNSFLSSQFGLANPGDWGSVTIDQFANDRNLGVVTEQEPPTVAAPGNNATPDDAQFLGKLAPHEKAGDDNLRLGFEIHGLISEADDVDVFSFDAPAGTEVWLDIDRTAFALDSVLALVDPNGLELAVSDNSTAETADPDLLVRNGIPANHVNPLAKSDFNIPDRYTVNPKDAGMRVVLPGPPGSTNTYYARVSSNGTSGAYHLQLRLRELDEVPGSTIRHSDIRFATDAIRVLGQPAHSPLLGEVTEARDAAGNDTNNSLGTAQDLGNLFNTDRGTLGVAGDITLPGDVDWYRFELNFDSARQNTVEYGSVILDVDYADGLARANSNIWVFDEQGNLIMTARDSNVAEDRPGPLGGSDTDDLSRGSVGPLDPYLGPVEMPARDSLTNGVYFVAVSSNAVIPDEFEQYLQPVPSNPQFRLEPVDSVTRIAEEHFEGSGLGNNLSNIARPAQVPVLFDNQSVVEFNLGDVVLFVSQDTGFNRTGLLMVDPFTGAVENRVGRINTNLEDITLNPAEGLLYGYNSFEGVANDGNTGNYHQVDPRSTTTTDLSVNLGDDTIETNNLDPANPANVERSPEGANNNGVGVHFDALTIGQNAGQDGTPGLAGYAVGRRAPNFGVQLTRNLLYEFNPVTGVAISDDPPGDRSGCPAVNPLCAGAFTQIRERTSLDTANDPIGPGNTVLLGAEATLIDPLTQGTTFNITDAQGSELPGAVTFTIDDGNGQIFRFEMNAGPEVRFRHLPNAGITVRDGDRFFLDGLPYEFDTGSVIVVTANGNQVQDGDTITITDDPPNVPNPRQPITRTFEFDLAGGLNNSNNVPIPFTRNDNNLQLINRIVTSINADSFNVQAVPIGQRISLLNENRFQGVLENAGGATISVEGVPGVGAGAVRIPVEESFNSDEFGNAIDLAVSGAVDASRDGDRINFSGARLADFSTIVNRGVFTNIGSDGRVGTGRIPVNFLAADDAIQTATRIVDAINRNTPIVAIRVGAGVQLQNGAFVVAATSPLVIGGTAPGGDITGLAFVGPTLYAVSDTGGLFRVLQPESNSFGVFSNFCFGACADFVESATDLLTADNGQPIRFMGLTAGPTNAEGGRYANMLFGIDVNGRLWAFDTAGRLQPVFVDGRTNVPTGLGGVTGLAFSNLDYNLWHLTDQRRNDAGHGVDPVFDGSRMSENRASNNSLYFGYEGPLRNGIPVNQFTNPINQNDYDFAGGAHGSLISNSFSLAGYAPEDRPTLYFNYFLDTENQNADLTTTNLMRDALRVYLSGDDGVWHLLTTNNSDRAGTDRTFPPNDEFDDPNLFDGIDVEVQETFDVGDSGAPSSWRQARVPLDDFAGQQNLRLRFDFSTAGGIGPRSLFGNLRENTVGHELRAIEASRLHDGQTFQLSRGGGPADVFEVDFGFTLNAPTGAAIPDDAFVTIDGIDYLFDSDGAFSGDFLALPGAAFADGDFFQVSDGINTATFEFEDISVATPDGVTPGSFAVPFTPFDASTDVAQAMATAINQAGLAVVASATGQVVQLTGASPSFSRGTTDMRPPGAFIIPFTSDQSSSDIAAAIEQTIRDNPPPTPTVVGDMVGTEANDTLASAVVTSLSGTTAVFQAAGAIGDNGALADFSLDVDIVAFNLQIGDRVEVDVDANDLGSTLNPLLRLFDANGNQLAASLNNPAPGELPSLDPFISFTVPVTGTYFAAVSGEPNSFYNPLLAGSGFSGSTGDYEIKVAVFDAGGLIHRAGHRINLPNAAEVLPVNLPANFIEGAPGTQNGFAVNVNLSMNSVAVADAVATSLASFYANGVRPAFKTYENTVRLVGHSIVGQNLGQFGRERFGAATALFGDEFGAFEASTNFDGTTNVGNPGARRTQDNLHEGVYIDDLIIGFTERGEMVSGASGSSNFIGNSAQPDDEIDRGAYQLEIRRGPEFGLAVIPPLPTLILIRSFDTNDRLTQQTSIVAPEGAALADGQTFTLSDGVDTLVFEFDDLNLPAGDADIGVQPGNVRVPFLASQNANQIAELLRDTINGPQVQNVLAVTAGISDGTNGGTRSSGNQVNLYGNATVGAAVIEEVAGGIRDLGTTNQAGALDLFSFENRSTEQIDQIVITLPPDLFFDSPPFTDPFSDFVGETATLSRTNIFNDTLTFDFTDFDPGEQFAFGIDVDGIVSAIVFSSDLVGSRVSVELDSGRTIQGVFDAAGAGPGQVASFGGVGLGIRQFDDFGDPNTVRGQGQILIEANRISNSLQFGILADAGTRDVAALAPQAGQFPHPGPVRVTSKLNGPRLVTGVTLANNLIINSGTAGIRFSGDPNPAGQQLSSVPFGRIINNTIAGPSQAAGPTQTGIGIQVDENASPTLLNNILFSLATGISVDPTSATTVVGGTVYQNNVLDTTGIGLGSFPMQLAGTDPLFIDPQTNNFYLAPGSRAIDSALDSLQDRPELLQVRQPLGLAASPILAPATDAIGQRRVDDPTVATPPGQGANVFKDRGALDRADFAGPTAVLLDPADNDAEGSDLDARNGFVEVVNRVLPSFSIQLLDGVEPNDPQEGTGPDDSTVRGTRVSVRRDGVELTQGLDYSFNYDATNNIIRLTALAGIWEPDRVYDIDLSNSEGIILTAPDGTGVLDGEQFDVTDQEGNTVTFEFESGYSLRVPQTFAIQVPSGGGLAISDGERFTITENGTSETFEFDNNGAFIDLNNDSQPDNNLIDFTILDSANEIANSIVAAVQDTALDLSPVNIVNFLGRAVHLGSKSIHTLNTSLTVLTQSGQAGGVEDGQSFTIDDGTKVVTFEFVVGPGGAPTPTLRPVPFTHAQTHEQIADAIVAAIRGASVGLNPTHRANSEGLINVGGTTRHILDVSDSTLTLSGLPGVRPEFGIKIPTVAGRPDFETIMDSETFIVSNQTVSRTFELDDDGATTPGNIVITFNANTSTNQLADAIAIAIRNAGIGLSPTNSGNGVVTLNATANHTLDTSNTSLLQIGLPGLRAARPVLFLPGDFYTAGVQRRDPIFTAEEMAVSIAGAINGANNSGLFSDVTATARGDQVILDGVFDTTASGSVLRSNIRDIAGNPLKPNRNDGTTRFTVFIGSGLDFGDAPNPYPTLESQNGARHEAFGDFVLGTTVDVDIDGQPSANADGDDTRVDDEDGVFFDDALIGGAPSQITVTASIGDKQGLLDAWIDYNRDGDWDDPNEQIFASQPLVDGPNELTFVVDREAANGLTYARFRLSSRGGLAPTGSAADGEVEDYLVQVQGNPWRNPNNKNDVSGDGVVAPLDILILMNELVRRFATNDFSLPIPPVGPQLPPPFYDVNANAQIDTNDILQVINFLNDLVRAGAEGEAAERTLSAAESQSVVAGGGIQDAEGELGSVTLVDHRISVSNQPPTAERRPAESTAAEDPPADLRWHADDRDRAFDAGRPLGREETGELEELFDYLASSRSSSSPHDDFFAGF